MIKCANSVLFDEMKTKKLNGKYFSEATAFTNNKMICALLLVFMIIVI